MKAKQWDESLLPFEPTEEELNGEQEDMDCLKIDEILQHKRRD